MVFVCCRHELPRSHFGATMSVGWPIRALAPTVSRRDEGRASKWRCRNPSVSFLRQNECVTGEHSRLDLIGLVLP